MQISPITTDDLDDIFALEQRMFASGSYPYFVLRQAYDSQSELFLIARDGTGCLGYILGTLQAGKTDGWCLSLCVDSEAQGMGIGRQLMQQLISRLKTLHAQSLKLHVAPDNVSAKALYESLGFTVVDRQADCFGKNADRLIMVLPITD